jgi:hypothetical protein
VFIGKNYLPKEYKIKNAHSNTKIKIIFEKTKRPYQNELVNKKTKFQYSDMQM